MAGVSDTLLRLIVPCFAGWRADRIDQVRIHPCRLVPNSTPNATGAREPRRSGPEYGPDGRGRFHLGQLVRNSTTATRVSSFTSPI